MRSNSSSGTLFGASSAITEPPPSEVTEFVGMIAGRFSAVNQNHLRRE
jgi:hypothetical protein